MHAYIIVSLANRTRAQVSVLAVACLLVATSISSGRLMEAASYQDLFDKAALVVIAKPTQTKDTDEQTVLEGIAVIGIRTQFAIQAVLKGDKTQRQLVLHHYRSVPTHEFVINGPDFLTFDLQKPAEFLLFLVKEPNGDYAPASGQIDPSAFSVLKLEGAVQ